MQSRIFQETLIICEVKEEGFGDKAMLENNLIEDARKMFIQPLIVSLGFSVIGEFILLIIYGIILFPGGNMIYKFLWTVVFCGIGMGATLGTGINLFVIGRYSRLKATLLTILLAVVVMGVACDLLCLNLDRQFHYFGAQTNPLLFSFGGIFGSLLAGTGIGGVLFSKAGQSLMAKIGI